MTQSPVLPQSSAGEPSPDILPPLSVSSSELSPQDQAALEAAYRSLERTSYAARLTNLLGRQIELASSMIPEVARKIASRAADKALRAAMHVALRSMVAPTTGTGKDAPDASSSRKGILKRATSRHMHRALATASGAAGGAFGISSLPLELPVSTVILLRAIADIARQEGEDPADPETALACMQVFALGGPVATDDSMDSGYFAVRTILARSISDAAKYVALTGAASETAPVLVRLLSQITARFGVIVTQKAAAQAVPVIGAIGGAAVNFAFMDHFQSLAHGHFAIRRLERAYGAERVRIAYEALRLKDLPKDKFTLVKT
jgi:hypothetical protein